MRVVTVRRLILNMRRIDRDAPSLLLRRLVNILVGRELSSPDRRQYTRDRRRQRRLAVVNMSDRANVAMRLRSLKLLLRHASFRSLRPKNFAIAARRPATYC